MRFLKRLHVHDRGACVLADDFGGGAGAASGYGGGAGAGGGGYGGAPPNQYGGEQPAYGANPGAQQGNFGGGAGEISLPVRFPCSFSMCIQWNKQPYR